jgi:hypothetical protein
MRSTGLSPPAGFHDASGAIGRKARLATRSAMWIQAWRRALTRLVSQCA